MATNPHKRSHLADVRRKYREDSGCVGIYEFANATGYSYKHIYEQVRRGRLGAKFERGQWLIPVEILERTLTELGSHKT